MISVVIVTHNSGDYISRCLEGLERQAVASSRIVIVDSGSDDPAYLEPLHSKPGYEVHIRTNIGFAAANNVGLRLVLDRTDYVCLMNPDTFLEPDSFESALSFFSDKSKAGVVGARLKGFDLSTGKPNGLLDSTGIFRSWYGRWYDRGLGQADGENFLLSQEVPAVCGAFMFCRAQPLRNLLPQVFDEAFFLYKEDIDLCLRLREKGWKLFYDPQVQAFHARGWSRDRREISYATRCLAARNEVLLTLKHRSPYLVWALGKYLAVRLLRL